MSTAIVYGLDNNLKTARPVMPCGFSRRKPLCLLCGILSTTVVLYIMINIIRGNRNRVTVDVFQTGFFDYNGTHDYDYIFTAQETCRKGRGNQSVFLTVVVETAPVKFAERQAIRETWGSWVKLYPNIRLVFLLGLTDNATQAKLGEENLKFNDIVQETFIDSYQNLSIKSVAVLRWVSTYCREAKYVLKSDDDMFIHIPNLINLLMKEKYERTILGCLVNGAAPIQDPNSKWYTPTSDFPMSTYPDYTSGTAYVVSGDIVYELYHMALHTKMFWLEDIYITGICAKRIKARLVNSAGFTFFKREVNGCAYKYAISGHDNTVEDIVTIWSDLQQNKTC
ncbi:beta-1,3-galactosyltransferase 1-like [Haliotis rufescens]|uniref:beta-1,3-galactosyltransferase 1-like n=1 Tax=Haliotis rufescens TaxID=6454 RepID=UPI00201F0480|nr:beta-1,3-galactosyltransferase 1-like [Haliotis rufescens]